MGVKHKKAMPGHGRGVFGAPLFCSGYGRQAAYGATDYGTATRGKREEGGGGMRKKEEGRREQDDGCGLIRKWSKVRFGFGLVSLQMCEFGENVSCENLANM